ncbi:hypothetical protein SY2F82_43360 [Streptomyces sp. Y2F8-2]|nr:hypothetical protein SY2F82_43360 [Streptomyces sp. Y2F8-2]
MRAGWGELGSSHPRRVGNPEDPAVGRRRGPATRTYAAEELVLDDEDDEADEDDDPESDDDEEELDDFDDAGLLLDEEPRLSLR